MSSDITLQPATKLSEIKPVVYSCAYLIRSENPGYKHLRYLATRLDESQFYLKIIAIELSDKQENNAEENYSDLINNSDKTSYKEIWIPWQRIIKVQNLTFKKK